MSKNPFEGLAKLYEKSVKEQDAKGFAEVYKQATELLFKRIKAETDLDLHFEDITYLDGYFIFGHGTNSVVHFHVKEAPGWLFGIWWSPIPTEETKNKKKPIYKTGQLFCELFFQFEEEIDKFKPAASIFGGNFEFEFEAGHEHGDFWKACKDLEFVINEPYLAFYKDMHYTNFNHEYVSREKAKSYWNKHWKEKAKRKEIAKINAEAMYETVKYIIKPMVKTGNAFIYDRGNGWNPRYQIFFRNVKCSDGNLWVDQEGCYTLCEGYEDAKTDEKLWKKTEKECAKRDGYKYYYDNPFSNSCEIRNSKNFNRILKDCEAEGSLLYYQKEDGTIYEGPVKTRYSDD